MQLLESVEPDRSGGCVVVVALLDVLNKTRLGRLQLDVPATSIASEQAGEHFGWLAGFAVLDARLPR